MRDQPLFWLSMLLVVAANVLYHWAQKSVPATVPASTSLLLNYLAALAASLLLLPFLGGSATPTALAAGFNWPSVWVGVAIVGVELGFLLAYRSGWPVNLASFSAAAALALVLIPVGAWLFGERWNVEKSLGMALCLAGLWLLTRR